MKTLEERAKKYADHEISGFPNGSIWAKGDVMIEIQMSYEDGATEQKKIDIDKACELLCDTCIVDDCTKHCKRYCYFRKAMEDD